MRRRQLSPLPLSLLGVVALGIAFVVVVQARAGHATLGTEFVVAQKADRQIRTLDAAWHAANGMFLLVWAEHPSHSISGGTEVHSGNDQIQARPVALDGTFPAGEFLISEGGGSKDFPQVAHVEQTSAPNELVSLVVWSDTRDGGRDIWAQVVAASGVVRQGSNFKLSDADDDLFPKVEYGPTSSTTGVFLVVWERESAAGESEVWGRLVGGAGSSLGTAVGSAFQISETTAGRAAAPALAFDDVNDRFLVVWGDDRGGASGDRDIWGQPVDTNGNLVGTNFQIASEAGLQRAPEVAYHGQQQEFLVVWNSAASAATQSDVHAQRLNQAGTAVGGVINVAATGAQEEAGDFDVNADTGSYVIPITGGPTVVDRNNVDLARVSRTGTVLGREQIATDTAANKGPATAVYGATQIGPGAGVAAVSEVLVVWRDARSAVDADGLLSQDLFARMAEVRADTDGDGLLDTWETNGYVDRNDNGVLDAGDFDFSTLPAADQPDVGRKDIYVEVDWMQVDLNADGDTTDPGEHTHAMAAGAPGSAPTGTPLDQVITVFANAPVANPDGSFGIDLHIDVGQMGGGGPIPETVGIDFDAGFEAVKLANFDQRREGVFHYAVRKHEGSGRAEIWGNDLWWRYTTATTQATGFMHELGHNLGLRHGGGDNINCKPNYFSIMSYTHQLQGMAPGLVVDYSRQALTPIIEGALNETVPLGGTGTFQATFSAGTAVVGPSAATADNVAINWDNDATPNETGAAVTNTDVNVFDQCNGSPAAASPNQTMNGFNDWANVRYNFRASPHFADGTYVTADEDVDREPLISFWRARFGSPSASLEKTAPATATPGDAVNFEVEIDNAGPGPARLVVEDTWPAGLTLTSAVPAPGENVLNGDGTRTLRWSLDPLASGGSTTITLTATVDFPPVGDTVTNAVEVEVQNVLGEPVATLDDTATVDLLFPELELEKSATASVNAGEPITYTLTYENVGDGDGQNVVVSDRLPAGVYYSVALDQGAGPQPTSVTANADGTTTLTWLVGTVPAGATAVAIEYTARPSLLSLPGDAIPNDASVDFSDANGNDYPAVSDAETTTVTAVPPTGNPRGLGFWTNHPSLWTAETLARIQATDDRFDTLGDGSLSVLEIDGALVPGGGMPEILEQQLLALYFNLATRHINADTAISSRTADRLGLATVRDAALFAQATLELPWDENRDRYSDATRVLDEINNGKSVGF